MGVTGSSRRTCLWHCQQRVDCIKNGGVKPPRDVREPLICIPLDLTQNVLFR